MLKEDLKNTLQFTLQVVGIILIVLLTIGFFNTPFDEGKAVLMTEELIAERDYVETMIPAIEKFTEQTTKINETNQLSSEGKIVSLKVAQVYAEVFNAMEEDYGKLSFIEVPERFRQFHTGFLKAMELKGASMNEILTYLQDSEPSHLSTVEKYDQAFLTKYQDSINLFNRLLEERKLK